MPWQRTEGNSLLVARAAHLAKKDERNPLSVSSGGGEAGFTLHEIRFTGRFDRLTVPSNVEGQRTDYSADLSTT